MGTLQAALEWARRGFKVFPLVENGKEPAIAGTDWQDLATTDAETITRMWMDPVLKTERSFNIGCDCTDMVVIDLDVKKGKPGLQNYERLFGDWDTLVVSTPSGGYHLYFAGPDSSNVGLADGIDVRSHRGYVAAPGSVIDGIDYRIVADKPMSWVPISIEHKLERPYVRNDLASVAQVVDSEASIQTAINYLQSCPAAIEGQRGDETTFKTAARMVREYALSVQTAFCLMRDHYNPRCSPPWSLEELWAKCENASNYGSVTQGSLTVEHLYGNMPEIAPPPTMFQQTGSDWGNALEPSRILPRHWVMDRVLLAGAVTMLLAPGSAGKSSVSLALAAHMALGKDFAGFKTKRPCKTMVYNGEDDLEEQSRRLLAVCISYALDFNAVKKNLMLLSSRELKLHLVTVQYNQPVRNDIAIRHVMEKTSEADVGLLILDPLVKVHSCDENNNVHMDAVMEVLTDIAHSSGIAVMALHHTTKGSSRQEDRIGNADIGRGGTAIINASRIAFTLLNASQQDAEEYGLRDEERQMWVRLDDAKMNLSLADNKATWFRKEGVRIPSNDIVGVLKHSVLEKSRNHIRIRIAQLIVDTMLTTNAGFLTMPQAIALVRGNEPLWANRNDREIRSSLEGLFFAPCDIKGKKIQCSRDANDKIILTMS